MILGRKVGWWSIFSQNDSHEKIPDDFPVFISDELTCVYNYNLSIIWFVFQSQGVGIIFKGVVFLFDRILDMEEDFQAGLDGCCILIVRKLTAILRVIYVVIRRQSKYTPYNPITYFNCLHI